MNRRRRGLLPWWRFRIYGLHPNPAHHYPAYAPKVLWHRLTHRLFGPLLGCSCSSRKPLWGDGPRGCFNSRWRIYWWREGVRDRVHLAELEKRVDKLERRERVRRVEARSSAHVTGDRPT